MQARDLITLCAALASISTASAQSYYFYTNYSAVINTAACPGQTCTKCATGFFNQNCGMDSYKLNGNNCQPCSNKPTNSYYLAWGTGTSVGADTTVCLWSCDLRYNSTGNQCTRGNCSIPTGNMELAPGTDWPECNTTCKAGYTGNKAIDPTTCTQCGLGTYAVSGSTTCSLGPAGKFLNSTGGTGIASCIDAPPGTYVAVQGSAAFVPYPAGSYSTATGATSPSAAFPCPSGNYCPQGCSSPIPAQPGTYIPNTGATSALDIKQCPTGTFNSLTGASACTNCTAGTYLGTAGATSAAACQTCPAGDYCPSGSSIGVDCPVGTANSVQGAQTSAACLPCNAPQYQDQVGQANCKACTFCAVNGQYKTGCGGANPGTCAQCTNTY